MRASSERVCEDTTGNERRGGKRVTVVEVVGWSTRGEIEGRSGLGLGLDAQGEAEEDSDGEGRG